MNNLSLIVLIIITVFTFQNCTEETETPLPEITSLSETEVTVMAGTTTTIAINGNNFGTDVSQVQVSLNGVSLPIQSVSANEIAVEIPLNATSGNVEVTVGDQTVTGPMLTVILQETVVDVEGNVYPVVTIGQQTWMAENLRATNYADGTPIAEVTSDAEWADLSDDSKAYAWYNNDDSNADPYGALYTWAAASGGSSSQSNPSGIQGACPAGWHLPSRDEVIDLMNFIESEQGDFNGITGFFTIFIEDASPYLKSTTGWPQGENGTDDYGFNAYPVGSRDNSTGVFQFKDLSTGWWTTAPDDNYNYFGILATDIEEGNPLVTDENYDEYPITDIVLLGVTNQTTGYTVRCVED